MATLFNPISTNYSTNSPLYSFEKQYSLNHKRVYQHLFRNHSKNNSQISNSIIWSDIYQSGIEQFHIFLTVKMDLKKIEMHGQLLKNGEFFRVTEKSKVIHVMEYLNQISINNQNTYNLKIHLEKFTIQVTFCENMSYQLKTSVSSILKHLKSRRQHILVFIKQQLSGILLCCNGSESKTSVVDSFHQSEKQKEKILDIKKQIIKARNNLFLIRNKQGKALIQQRIIPQFQESELKVQQINEFSHLLFNLPKTKQKTQNSNHRTRLQQYYPYLTQQPVQKTLPHQRLENYSPIYLGFKNGQQMPQWKQIVSTERYKLKLGICSFSTLSSNINPDGSITDKIDKLMALKQCQQKSQIRHQKQVIKRGFSKISSDYFPKYYVVGNDKEKKYKDTIIMDYHKITMFDYVKKNRAVMSNSSKLKIMIGIAQGLRVMETQKIIHMDLKPDNVLITKGLCPKIIDFGQSIINYQIQDNEVRKSSVPYVAPQFADKKEIANSFDTYSFGMMLDQIISNYFIIPHRRVGLQKLKMLLANKQYPSLMYLNIQKFVNQLPSHTAQLMIVLILLCLHPVPEMRPNQDCIAIILQVIEKVNNIEMS